MFGDAWECMEPIEKARFVSIKVGYVSASNIQRKLRIGYPWAARLIDELIKEGFCEDKRIPNTTHFALLIIGGGQ